MRKCCVFWEIILPSSPQIIFSFFWLEILWAKWVKVSAEVTHFAHKISSQKNEKMIWGDDGKINSFLPKKTQHFSSPIFLRPAFRCATTSVQGILRRGWCSWPQWSVDLHFFVLLATIGGLLPLWLHIEKRNPPWPTLIFNFYYFFIFWFSSWFPIFQRFLSENSFR